MTTTTKTRNLSLGDRYSDLAVVILTLVALLAGWLYGTSVENRSVTFEKDGITVQTPEGWLQVKTSGSELLHVTDPAASGFGTTYILQNLPVPADAAPAQSVSLLTVERGQALTAYRVLDQQKVSVFGREAYEINYVFVESNPNLTHTEIPSVVRGVDYIFIAGDHAVVATYWAAQDAFEAGLARFHKFLESLKF